MPVSLNSSKTTLTSPAVCTQTREPAPAAQREAGVGEVAATKVSDHCGTPVLPSTPCTAPPPTSRCTSAATSAVINTRERIRQHHGQ